MNEPTRAEQIVYLTEWAAKNGMMLQLNGQVGFGRECTGISEGGHYVDTEEVKNALAYDHDAPPDSWWEPEDSYHKHDCLAVLGHGDGPLRQLYDWVKWLDERGFTVTEEARRPSSDVDLLLHGVSLAKLVAPGATPSRRTDWSHERASRGHSGDPVQGRTRPRA